MDKGHIGQNGCVKNNWKGGRRKRGKYVSIKKPGNLRADSLGYVWEHIFIAETVYGKHLPTGACVHHVNGNGHDNRPENLVICQDNPYHHLLHTRERAWTESGSANKRKCTYCKKYDSLENLMKRQESYCHKLCRNEYQRQCYIHKN